MKYKDGIEKNKAYVNLGMNDSKKNELLENCKNKKKEIKSGVIDLKLRRNEKMNKERTYLDIIQKVCVASVSIIATGAIILGVSKYNADNKKVAVTTEKITEKITENTTEKITEETTEKIDNTTDGYSQVFAGTIEKGLAEGSLDTSLGQVKLGDYVCEIEGTDMEYPTIDSQHCMWLAIKGKNDDKFTKIKDFKFQNIKDVYSDGKIIYATYENYVNKYDIENNKVEQMDISKDKSLTENREREEFGDYALIYNVVTIKKGVIYLDAWRRRRNTENDLRHDIVAYNTNSKKFSVEIEKYYNAYIDYEGYMVARHRNDEDDAVLVLYSFTSDGLHEEKQIFENSEYLLGSIDSKNIIYFAGDGKHEFIKPDGYEFMILTNVKMYSYDIKNDVLKELAEMDIEDFGKDSESISGFELIDENMCWVLIDKKKAISQDYKYTYATKKIEKGNRLD